MELINILDHIALFRQLIFFCSPPRARTLPQVDKSIANIGFAFFCCFFFVPEVYPPLATSQFGGHAPTDLGLGDCTGSERKVAQQILLQKYRWMEQVGGRNFGQKASETYSRKMTMGMCKLLCISQPVFLPTYLIHPNIYFYVCPSVRLSVVLCMCGRA